VPGLAGEQGLGYEMAYRFPFPPSRDQLRDDMARLRDSLPPGTVTGSFNYLPMREAYNYTNQSLLNLLIAFGVFALAASLATIVNLVLGTVLASYREIGIVKALGFTPAQVVATLVVGMVIPALIGCAIGIPAGAALSLPLVTRAAQGLGLSTQPGVSPVASLLALVAILGCVTVAAALPALRAGRMSAVAAIAAGGTPRSPRLRRPSRWLRRLRLPRPRWLRRLRLPRPLTLGAGDAFVRPLRGGLTVLAVLIGVTMIVFAFGLREAITWYLPAAARIGGDVSISRESTVPDSRVTSVLSGQSQTQDVLAVWHGSLVVPGLADQVSGVAFRGDPVRLGWSNFLDQGRWLGPAPGEVLLPLAVLNQAHLKVGDSFDAVLAGRPLHLHVVGEVSALNAGYAAFFNWSTLAAALPDAQPDRYDVVLKPGSDPDGYAAAVRGLEPDFLTVTVNHVSSNDTIDAMNAIVPILALMLGLVAAVGVFSTMLLHVRERARDNAILKAVGMSPRQLLAMVLTSSAVLGVIGGLAGIPAGVFTYRALISQVAHQSGNDLPPIALDVPHPGTLYALSLTGLGIALVGALLPARRAARSPVAEILRSE
jgi:putative ABC transport system permease protein